MAMAMARAEEKIHKVYTPCIRLRGEVSVQIEKRTRALQYTLLQLLTSSSLTLSLYPKKTCGLPLPKRRERKKKQRQEREREDGLEIYLFCLFPCQWNGVLGSQASFNFQYLDRSLGGKVFVTARRHAPYTLTHSYIYAYTYTYGLRRERQAYKVFSKTLLPEPYVVVGVPFYIHYTIIILSHSTLPYSLLPTTYHIIGYTPYISPSELPFITSKWFTERFSFLLLSPLYRHREDKYCELRTGIQERERKECVK